MFGLRVPELLLILVIVLLVFGASRLPELARSMGGAIRNFKRGMSDEGEATARAEGAPADKRDA